MSEARIADICRSCGSGDLTLVLDLGEQYLSDFRDNDSKPPKFPLTLMFCEECTLVQLAHTVPRELLYTDNYGYRSGVNEEIVADLKSIVDRALIWKPAPRSWLDIASNDGTLLSFVPEDVTRIGVDPVAKFLAEASAHANMIFPGFFSSDMFPKHYQFDVITSISMFYDIDNLNEFVAGVKKVLAPNGIWVIQQNYLLPMIQLGAVDNVCHEHLTYFSLRSLEHLLRRHGLKIMAVGTSDVNGGVIRTIIGHGSRHDDYPLLQQWDLEEKACLHRLMTYYEFRERVENNLHALNELLCKIQDTDTVIYIYGASTRGAVLWQASQIERYITAAVERQKQKIGKWFSPIGVPIISEEQMRRDRPDILLVGPWWHRDQFIEREKQYLEQGGSMIFPLPKLEVYAL